MSEELDPGAEFLSRKYAKLPGSKWVDWAIDKRLREGEKGPTNREERMEVYLDQLENNITDPDRFRRLKHIILERHTTKYDDIPESYWQAQEVLMRQRGEAGDWASATPEQQEQVRHQTAEAVLTDQRASLEQWLDYFASPDADHIPRSLKYWVFRSVLGMQELVKKKDGEREYIEFPKRSKGTVKPFPDINYEALAYVVDAMVRKLHGQGMEFEHDIQPEERGAFQQFLAKEDFGKLYAWANELMQPIPPHLLPVTEGHWVTYPQDSDPTRLVRTIRGKGTGWCTAGLNTARTHLQGGDFYVYYTRDDNGEYTLPRIAIRMEGHDKIAEDPRGIAYKQNLDPYMVPILDEKLAEFGPVGEAYKKKSADMTRLTVVENKTILGQPLTRDDLAFLYELDDTIEGFGYQKDPRVAELRATRNADKDFALLFPLLMSAESKTQQGVPCTQAELKVLYEVDEPLRLGPFPRTPIEDLRLARNPEQDMLVVFDCTPEQIARTSDPDQITADTKAYVGPVGPGIFDALQHYGIEHVYTGFPEKKLRLKSVTNGQILADHIQEQDLRDKTEGELAKLIVQTYTTTLTDSGNQIGDYTKQMLANPAFPASRLEPDPDHPETKRLKSPERVTLVFCTVGDLFPEKTGTGWSVTTSQLIGTEQDTDSQGNPAPFTGGRVTQFGAVTSADVWGIGPELRLAYADQPMGEWRAILSRPLAGADGSPCVFSVKHGGSGRWLRSYGWAKPVSEWNPDDQLVLCLRKSPKALGVTEPVKD